LLLLAVESEKRRDENVLDLHGCSVKEALTIVKERLNEWYTSGKYYIEILNY